MRKTISELIDNEYREFSMYVIENRAIPSVVDGLKPSQRKLLYVAIKTAKTKKQKVAALAANLASMANYSHGEASAQATCVGMATNYSNNLPLLEEHGSFGSRLIQESAAPRYIYSKLSENFEKFFKDEDVCPANYDPDNPEPMHYLPILPWVLVNGVKGIAVGFATEILPRNPKDLIKVIKNKTEGKGSYNKLIPKFPEFKGEVEPVGPNQWEIKGVVSNNKLEYNITEVPYGYDRETYVSVLDKLEDDNKIIEYIDSCDESGFNFTIKVNRSQKAEIEKDPLKYFKLIKRSTENFTCLDEHGHLIQFNDVNELVDYFYEYRIKKSQEMVECQISKVGYDLQKLKDRLMFITRIENGDYDPFKKSRAEFEQFVFDNITQEDYGKEFIKIPVYNLSRDEIDKLKQSIVEKQKELDYWCNITATQYLNELLTGV